MKINHAVENPPDFDPELFQAELQQAQLLHGYRQERWRKIGEELRQAFIHRNPKPRNEVANLDPQLHKQNPLMRILKTTFNLAIDLDEPFKQRTDTTEVAHLRNRAPHILAGLGWEPGFSDLQAAGLKPGNPGYRKTIRICRR